MSKANGFVSIRRGLWEHVRDGRLGIHLHLLPGRYAHGDMERLRRGELGPLPRTRDVLERLEHGDYIRRFLRPGERFCYPILVHKFPITQGHHKWRGYRRSILHIIQWLPGLEVFALRG